MVIYNLIKKYWIELIVFGVIAGITLIDLTPDITWIDTNSDGAHYIYAAKYLYPSHKSSAPLYLLLGHLFLMIPYGTEAWRMALISGISGVVGSIFIYFCVKELLYKYTVERKFDSKMSNFVLASYYGLIAAIIYGGSALALSQNIIVETYPLVTTLGIMAFYFCIKKKWVLASLMIGASGAVHPISLFVSIPLIIAYRELRNWRYIGLASLFILFYLYIPITNRAPYMWNSPNSETGFIGFIGDTISTANMLSGGISIWDFPKRILDAGGQLIVCFGIGTIVLTYFILKYKFYKNVLFWLMIIPVLYYVTDLAPQTNVYMQPSIAFGAIIIGIGFGLSKLNKRWITATVVVSIGILAFNANYFDIGRTLDKNLSAREFYNKELSKVPNEQILLAQQGWEWAIVFPYNMDNGRNIIPVATGTLPSKKYQDLIKSMGVKFDVPSERLSLPELQDYLVRSVIKNNSNVWITVPSNPETYGAIIVPVIGNEDKIITTPDSILNRGMAWQLKPSNPYDIFTGSIEVNEWIYIVFSNYSVLTFLMMAVSGAIPIVLIYMIIKKKKKWSFNKLIDNVKSEV